LKPSWAIGRKEDVEVPLSNALNAVRVAKSSSMIRILGMGHLSFSLKHARTSRDQGTERRRCKSIAKLVSLD
jgi:hypothetical protein